LGDRIDVRRTRVIIRTEDGGQTWRDVSPPAVPEGGSEVWASFHDSSHAWAAFNVSELDESNWEQQLVWRTTDGGETWQPSRPLDLATAEEFTVNGISTVDRQTGWLLALVGNRPATSAPFESALFRTEDGGETWARQEYATVADGYLIDTTLQRKMDFADPDIGLISLETGNPPFLLWSENGGLTWERRQLPSPSWYWSFFTPECSILDTQLVSGQSVAALVACPGRLRSIDTVLYRTENGGSSWEALRLPEEQGSWSIWSMEFLDEDTGWLFGPTIYETRDGGGSWRAVKRVGWDEAEFDFVDPEHGWAVARRPSATVTTATWSCAPKTGGRGAARTPSGRGDGQNRAPTTPEAGKSLHSGYGFHGATRGLGVGEPTTAVDRGRRRKLVGYHATCRLEHGSS
jgi:photosystem II stability/assembly factor-like uncharacterized protein